jgi:hypothetical protein
MPDPEALLTARHSGCRFANEVGLFLEPSLPLRDIGQAIIAVPKQSQGSVHVQVLDLDPQEIQVDLDAPTLGFVAQVCSDHTFDPSEVVILDDTGRIKSDSILRTVRGVLKCTNQPQVPSVAQVPGLVSTQAAPKLQSGAFVVLSAALASALPDFSDIDEKFPASERRQKYPFVYDGKPFEMEIPDSATVADTKEFVARKFKSMAENVKLLHLGLELKDTFILSQQRIKLPNRILVYIRAMESIYLESCAIALTQTAEKPPTYMEQLRNLVREARQDTCVCARAFQYYNYNYAEALAELLKLPPD